MQGTVVVLSLLIIGWMMPISMDGVLVAQKQRVETATKSKKKRHSISSRRRRSNTVKGRQQALLFLQSHPDLAKLAGLPYNPPADTTMLRKMVQEDSEVLTDVVENLEPTDENDSVEFDSTAYDINAFYAAWEDYTDQFEDEDITAAGVEKQAIVEALLEWIGTPYRYGGMSRRGIDCSALVQKVYQAAAAVILPRTARVQYTLGQPIENVDDLRFGDLVFFHTRRNVYVSHVGIYLGHRLFAHASSRYGVTISSLDSPYYRRRFIGGRRLTVDDLFQLQSFAKGQMP